MARDLTLGELCERLVAVHGSRGLVEEPDGARLTYDDAADLVAHWAGGLHGAIEPGDRVVVALPNSYRFLLACLAVVRAGGVAVPVNAKMAPAEIDYVVADSG